MHLLGSLGASLLKLWPFSKDKFTERADAVFDGWEGFATSLTARIDACENRLAECERDRGDLHDEIGKLHGLLSECEERHKGQQREIDELKRRRPLFG